MWKRVTGYRSKKNYITITKEGEKLTINSRMYINHDQGLDLIERLQYTDKRGFTGKINNKGS